MASDAWTMALMNAGLGMLGSAGRGDNTATALANGGRGALAGYQSVQQAGQANRQNMIQMAQLKSDLQNAALQRQKYQADMATTAKKRESDAAFKSTLDPKYQPLFDVDRAAAIKQAFPEGLTPYQQQQLAVKRERLGFDRDKENYDRESGGDATTSAMRLRAAKIQDAIRLQGVDEAQATALVDSQTSIVTSPVDGRSMLVNRGTGGADPVAIQRDPVPMMGKDGLSANKPSSIDDMAKESGAWAQAGDIAERTVGQLAPSIISGDRAKAKVSLKMLTQQAVSAFSLSSRPNLAEQERIASMLQDGEWLDAPERAKVRLETLRDESLGLRNQYATLINSGRLPVDQENDMLLKVTELERLVGRLGAEGEGLTINSSPSVTGAIPDNAPASDQALGDDPLGLFQ